MYERILESVSIFEFWWNGGGPLLKLISPELEEMKIIIKWLEDCLRVFDVSVWKLAWLSKSSHSFHVLIRHMAFLTQIWHKENSTENKVVSVWRNSWKEKIVFSVWLFGLKIVMIKKKNLNISLERWMKILIKMMSRERDYSGKHWKIVTQHLRRIEIKAERLPHNITLHTTKSNNSDNSSLTRTS